MQKYFLFLIVAIFAFPAFAQEEVKVPEYQQERYDIRKAEIAKLDLNRDGFLDVKELNANMAVQFRAADKDADGFISPEESSGFIESFKEQQSELYGDKTKARSQSLGNRLTMADVNKDDKISWPEYSEYFGRRYKVFDRNGDGKIDALEYRTDAERVPRSYYQEPDKKN